MAAVKMMMELEWAELHSPIFLAGTNLQMKLDPTKRTGLKLLYDREHKELHITYKGKTAIVPSTSVLSMVEGKVKPRPEVVTPNSVGKIVAQASTPQDHVFAGPGGGKSNDRA